jgi:hypothetical protein
MKITTYETQVSVVGYNGQTHGVNIFRAETYCAQMNFWGDAYVVKQPGAAAGVVIMLIPSPEWIPDLEAKGYVFIGHLKEIIKQYEP